MPLASVAYTVNETLTWETASDWDNAVDEAGVVHEGYGDLPGAGTVQLGYPSFDRGGSALAQHIPWDEDSGSTVSDVSSNGNDVTMSGGTGGVTGLHNTNAWDFDGTDDEGTFSSIDLTSGYTLIGWFNCDDVNTQGHVVTENGGGKIIVRVHDGELRFYHNDGAWNLVAQPAISANTDYHFGFTWNGSTATAYLDSTSLNSMSLSSLSTDDAAGSYGYEAATGEKHYPGRIYTTQIYQRGFSSSEVQAHYDTGTGGHLETATKSFTAGAAKPDLQNLDYTLNSESISLDVIGSPGTADEETVTQALDGATSYSLSWTDSHTDFRVKPTISTADITTSPTVNRLELTN